jgi:hypothetical protein
MGPPAELPHPFQLLSVNCLSKLTTKTPDLFLRHVNLHRRHRRIH